MPADVRLKPIFGLDPKSWLTGIYGLVLATIALVVVFGPALVSPGTRLTVVSTPSGASVEWNGTVWGITPLTVDLPRGSAPLIVRRPGFVASVHTFKSESNPFNSLVFAHQETVTIRLLPRSSTSVLEEAALNIGRWSQTAPADDAHPLPPLFVPFVADLQATGASLDQVREALRGLRALVADHDLYVDYGRAWGLWKDQPPASLKVQADLWDSVLNPGSMSKFRINWLLACQSAEVRARIVSSGDAEFQTAREAWQTATATQPEDAEVTVAPALNTSTGLFRAINAGWFYWGRTNSPTGLPTSDPWRVPVLTRTERFWIAEAAVSSAQLAPFWAAKPQWKTATGGLSWYAAAAYVAWLNGQPGRPAGLEYALVSQQEWEAAMRAHPTLWASVQGRWEWTASPWGAADYLVAGDNDAPLSVPSYARTAKGGRVLWGRAGLEPSFVSPTLGLRLALKPLTAENTP